MSGLLYFIVFVQDHKYVIFFGSLFSERWENISGGDVPDIKKFLAPCYKMIVSSVPERFDNQAILPYHRLDLVFCKGAYSGSTHTGYFIIQVKCNITCLFELELVHRPGKIVG